MSDPAIFKPLVAIFNSAEEVLERLRGPLEEGGYRTVVGRLADVYSGALDLVAFVEEYDPQVLLIDVPRPYERHLNLLRLLRHVGPLRRCVWVLRTLHKEALEVLVGSADDLGVIADSPGGPDEIVGAVRQALASRG